MNWRKTDLINELSAIRGYRNYLEICTPTTGGKYRAVDRLRFSTCHRLMYRCPADFDDGLPVDFRSQDLDIARCVRDIRARGLRFDLIFIDPFHEYEASARDLREASELMERNGTIIVHDCFPRDEKIARPRFQPGAWCGVTYKAYLDFVLANAGLKFCTVDIDYGCGVIRSGGGRSRLRRIEHYLLARMARDDRRGIIRQWKRAGVDYDAAFRLLQEHASSLLNLVTVDAFLQGERDDLPVLR
jgi:hypothetical protein